MSRLGRVNYRGAPRSAFLALTAGDEGAAVTASRRRAKSTRR